MADRNQLDLLQAINQLHLERLEHDSALEGKIESLELAFRMQFSAPEVFDIRQETQATLDRLLIQPLPQYFDSTTMYSQHRVALGSPL